MGPGTLDCLLHRISGCVGFVFRPVFVAGSVELLGDGDAIRSGGAKHRERFGVVLSGGPLASRMPVTASAALMPAWIAKLVAAMADLLQFRGSGREVLLGLGGVRPRLRALTDRRASA